MSAAMTSALSGARAQAPLAPRVEVEERIYTYEPANNGAGPMWCYGSTSGFGEAIEIASREKTCGHISNLDLWLDRDGRARLL